MLWVNEFQGSVTKIFGDKMQNRAERAFWEASSTDRDGEFGPGAMTLQSPEACGNGLGLLRHAGLHVLCENIC